MYKCIYCTAEQANSKEHYMPACMGSFRNLEPLLNKLCNQCNGKISLIEEQFCRCGPEAFFRIIKGIRGRKYHKKPNPFYRGSAGAKRITIKTKHPTKDCLIYCELEEGKLSAYPARQIIFHDAHKKYHSVLITDKIKTAEDLLKELEVEGIAGSQPVECFTADPDETEWMEELFSGFDIKIKWSEMFPYEGKSNTEIIATCQVNEKYFRCIAKIAFHYFLKHFTQFTGFEEEFKGIKNFIMNGGNASEWITQERDQFIEDLRRGVMTKEYFHVLAVEKSYFQIIARTQFFIGPHLVPQHYKIIIGKNPEKLHFHQSVGHQFVYFDKPDQERRCGVMVPLLISKKSLLPYA